MNSADATHIAIIGAGAAGLNAAITAAKRGARITLIEHRRIGGDGHAIQLRFLQSEARSSRAGTCGAARPAIDRTSLLARQQALADEYRAACEAAIEEHPEITLMWAEARFLDERTLIARLNDDSRKVSFRKVRFDQCLIATGTMVALPSVSGLGDTPYWTVAEALRAPSIPPRLNVLGSSPATLELAQCFARLGSHVRILTGSSLLPDASLDQALAGAFRDEGIEIIRNAKAEEIAFDDGIFRISTDAGVMESERLLLSTGTIPNTYSLCLDFIDMELDASGAILVDDRQRTSVDGILAAGGCTHHPQAAASAGRAAAINMTGGDATMVWDTVPTVIFTDPEIASVGLVEDPAPGRIIDHRLRLDEIPGAQHRHGFIRITAEADSLRLIGAQAASPHAGEIIHAAALAIRAGMRIAELADQAFASGTEAAVLGLCGRALLKGRD